MNFKELRRGMIVLANTFDEIRSSRETALAKTSTQLQMAKDYKKMNIT